METIQYNQKFITYLKNKFTTNINIYLSIKKLIKDREKLLFALLIKMALLFKY